MAFVIKRCIETSFTTRATLEVQGIIHRRVIRKLS
jgi:hypothetical protein